jgi:probable HAF family extracellular repeat protein
MGEMRVRLLRVFIRRLWGLFSLLFGLFFSKSKRSFTTVMILSALAEIALLPEANAASTYTFTPFDAPNATGTYLIDINDNGQVLGAGIDSADVRHFFVYNLVTKNFIPIDIPNATSFSLRAINNNGQITGIALTIKFNDNTTQYFDGFIYDLFTKTYTTLLYPAYGISNNGQVAGSFYDTASHGFVYNGSTYSIIDVSGTSFGTNATDVNNNGQVVGHYQFDDLVFHSFVYDPITKSFTNIDELNSSSGTLALGINDSGQVSGSLPGVTRGFVYDPLTKAFAILAFPNSIYTAAYGINNNGQVVGYFTDSIGGHGFIATPNPISPPILIDPVSVFLDGPQITSAITQDQKRYDQQPFLADVGKGREVKGVATDGVAQVIIRIPASQTGEVFDVGIRTDQCGIPTPDCVDNYGLIFDPHNPPSSPSLFSNTPDINKAITSVTAVDTDQGPMAFAAYRAPVDFVRSGVANSDDQEAQRSVFVSINSVPNGVQPDLEIKLVRPPVILVHGFNSESKAWDTFEPFFDHSLFYIDRVEYGDPFPYKTNQGRFIPPLPVSQIVQPKKSHFGLDYNAEPVISQIRYKIRQYKEFCSKFNDLCAKFQQPSSLSIPVAAVSADIIAHSMGGMIIKYGSTIPKFSTSDNYNTGYIHKIISLGTPYFGTPQAVIQLAQGSQCSRFLASAPPANTFAIDRFIPTGSNKPIMGAVHDLQGRGDGQNLSSILKKVNSASARSIPTAVIAGSMGVYLQSVNDVNALDLIYRSCGPTTDIQYETVLGVSRTTVPGFVTSIEGGAMHRERDGDVDPSLVPGRPTKIIRHNIRDSYSLYLTQTRFPTQFDPTIKSSRASSGKLAVDSDGSVPISSAQGGYSRTTILNDYLHSVGWKSLIRTVSIGKTNHLQNSQQAATLAQELLNTNLRDSQFNKE